MEIENWSDEREDARSGLNERRQGEIRVTVGQSGLIVLLQGNIHVGSVRRRGVEKRIKSSNQ